MMRRFMKRAHHRKASNSLRALHRSGENKSSKRKIRRTSHLLKKSLNKVQRIQLKTMANRIMKSKMKIKKINKRRKNKKRKNN